MKKFALILMLSLLLGSCGNPGITPNNTADTDPAEIDGAGRVTATAESADTDTLPAPSPSDTAEADTTDIADSTEPAAPQGSGQQSQTDTPPTYPEGDYEPKVFMYHLILDEPYSIYEDLFVRPSELEEQIGILDSLGYDYAFAEDYGIKPRPTAILTFDDGYEDNYTEMFPILKKTGAKATVFLATSLVGTDGYLTETQIREMSASGLVSFQSHTVSHCELSSMSADRIASELKNSIDYIESLTGQKVRALAYPAGRYSDAAVAEVSKYVDFAYTTKSPSNTPSSDALLLPRWRISRGCSAASFRSIVTP